LKGVLAGFVATIPMTIFMLATQRFLPKGQRYALPPEIITKELTQRAHMRQHMSKRQIVGATLVSHFGYGSSRCAHTQEDATAARSPRRDETVRIRSRYGR
jgi:hypothetical protein